MGWVESWIVKLKNFIMDTIKNEQHIFLKGFMDIKLIV